MGVSSPLPPRPAALRPADRSPQLVTGENSLARLPSPLTWHQAQRAAERAPLPPRAPRPHAPRAAAAAAATRFAAGEIGNSQEDWGSGRLCFGERRPPPVPPTPQPKKKNIFKAPYLGSDVKGSCSGGAAHFFPLPPSLPLLPHHRYTLFPPGRQTNRRVRDFAKSASVPCAKRLYARQHRPAEPTGKGNSRAGGEGGAGEGARPLDARHSGRFLSRASPAQRRESWLGWVTTGRSGRRRW